MAILKTAYLAASRVSRRLPPGLLYGVADGGGLAWYLLGRRQAADARRNYAAVLGVSERDPAAGRVARQAFKNYGRMLADFVLIGTAPAQEILARLTYEGREYVDDALSGGRGCILAIPHSGSWDVAGCVAAILGYPIVAIAQTFPGSLDDAVVAGRERFGLKVVPLDRSALRRVEKAVSENRIAALLCDIQNGSGGAEVTFFGRRVKLPAGPGALARRTGAPVLPVGIRRLPDGSYRALVQPPLEAERTSDRHADAARLMQAVAEAFETFIRESPESWYAFRPILGPAPAPARAKPVPQAARSPSGEAGGGTAGGPPSSGPSAARAAPVSTPGGGGEDRADHDADASDDEAADRARRVADEPVGESEDPDDESGQREAADCVGGAAGALSGPIHAADSTLEHLLRA